MADGKGVAWREPNPKAQIMLLQAPRMYEALPKALTQEGKPYDKLDILGIILDKDWFTVGSFICSTLVLWSFEEIGGPLLNPSFIPYEHITPRDLLLSTGVSELKL